MPLTFNRQIINTYTVCKLYTGELLTLSQTFRLFQTGRVCRCRRNYKFDENGRVLQTGRREIALSEQFLLFPQCFQRTCIADT